ncbi:hypothetical protein [Runella slithyformis]|uniref:Uncharacterized protein n=1 Tax=Runella slithyformis (strain ATCC 29530 / DSM 19594 / LMG 11500 / NCIMB 11436 / LSU 4) TaxID=761193 RepID=A0A7U4E4B4_RUNSL|nr:hypothetical protein [Runella slithyformis]AEI47268.1 hypothetical protein Runsl_0830 [Runella slithyformis DSM 19594]
MSEKERLSQLEEVVSEILVKQDRIAEEVANLSLKVALNSIDIAGLKVAVASVETKVDRLEIKVDRLEIKVDRLETKVDNHTGRIVDIQQDIKAGQAELRNSMEILLHAIKNSKP